LRRGLVDCSAADVHGRGLRPNAGRRHEGAL
jgi:hypothetical protein